MMRLGCALVASLIPAAAFAQPVIVSGTVTDGLAPLAGAIVCGVGWDAAGRIAMPIGDCLVTDVTGEFAIETTLTNDGEQTFGQITAGAEGYFNGDLTVLEGATSDVVVILDLLAGPDNAEYVWWQPRDDPERSCDSCHGTIVEQWEVGRHAIAVTDPWVANMYDGTHADGTEDVAPGYQLDYADAGDCGACHAATASWSLGETVDMNGVPEVHQWGVSCEACHKIRSTTPGAAAGTLGSVTLWRPPPMDGEVQRFNFGAYPNVLEAAAMTAYLPLFREAELCAACHQYTNPQGVLVMDTWDNWQALGNNDGIVPCQGCHMKDLYNVGPGDVMEWLVDDPDQRLLSAQRRDPNEVYRHEIWGGEQYASHALDLLMSVDLEDDAVVVGTSVMNIGANHRVPTGMPFRDMILVVSAVPEGGGDPLPLLEGSLVGPRGGDIADQPGRMFAKSMGDADGNLTFSFWDATQILEDTRLATSEFDDREFRFEAPASGSVVVTARLLYRRASQPLADAKGWDMGEQEIGRAEEIVPIDEPDGGASDGGADGGGGADAGYVPDYQDGFVCRATPGGSAGGTAAALLVAAVFALVVRRRTGRRLPR